MQKANSKALQKMDVKKNRTSSWDSKKLVSFIGDVRRELRKIEWTTRDELKVFTKIVLVSIFLFGIFVYVIDVFMRTFLGGLEVFLKIIGG
ncbi:MAG: preprotein translocase subunit SecE [Chlamydiia bacterium]|nr:preprotein translocase subunit SecE [Chlamydiia bacterium]